jgi:hypothetical protein
VKFSFSVLHQSFQHPFKFDYKPSGIMNGEPCCEITFWFPKSYDAVDNFQICAVYLSAQLVIASPNSEKWTRPLECVDAEYPEPFLVPVLHPRSRVGIALTFIHHTYTIIKINYRRIHFCDSIKSKLDSFDGAELKCYSTDLCVKNGIVQPTPSKTLSCVVVDEKMPVPNKIDDYHHDEPVSSSSPLVESVKINSLDIVAIDSSTTHNPVLVDNNSIIISTQQDGTIDNLTSYIEDEQKRLAALEKEIQRMKGVWGKLHELESKIRIVFPTIIENAKIQ